MNADLNHSHPSHAHDHNHHDHRHADSAPPASARAAGAQWTCRMHPEIVRDAPGDCPICGMALEPRTVTGEENPELRDMQRRFWVCLALSVPTLLLAMGDMMTGGALAHRLPLSWIQF